MDRLTEFSPKHLKNLSYTHGTDSAETFYSYKHINDLMNKSFYMDYCSHFSMESEQNGIIYGGYMGYDKHNNLRSM